jgi:hypothetical protein
VGTIADGALTLVRDDPDFGIPVTWLYTKRR